MAQPFLALITPLSDARPDNTLPMPQPPVDPGYSPPWARPQPPRPDNTLPIPPGPVDPGYSPPWARPGGGPVDPGYSPPWARPQPPRPGWPVVPGWGGSLPGGGGFPGQGGPVDPGYSPPWARPPLGIWGPTDPRPTPPIYIPPEGSPPPLGIWGPPDPRPGWGLPGPQPHPEHPIVLPPDLPEETPEGGKITWKTAWTPVTGWVVVGIPSEGTLVPTPSR